MANEIVTDVHGGELKVNTWQVNEQVFREIIAKELVGLSCKIRESHFDGVRCTSRDRLGDLCRILPLIDTSELDPNSNAGQYSVPISCLHNPDESGTVDVPLPIPTFTTEY
jgi:hypothetical protein